MLCSLLTSLSYIFSFYLNDYHIARTPYVAHMLFYQCTPTPYAIAFRLVDLAICMRSRDAFESYDWVGAVAEDDAC
jgi:hypothetical protein